MARTRGRGRGRGGGRGRGRGGGQGQEYMRSCALRSERTEAKTRSSSVGNIQEEVVGWKLKPQQVTDNDDLVGIMHLQEKASSSEPAVSYVSGSAPLRLDVPCINSEQAVRKKHTAETASSSEQEVVSHELKSLLRPHIPCANKRPRMVALDAYLKEFEKYNRAPARQEYLPAIGRGQSGSCRFAPQVSLDSSSTRKLMILSATKFVVGLSSSLDGKQISQCSGILINFDRRRRSVTILTSTYLFCTKHCFDEWSTNKRYSPEAQEIRGAYIIKDCFSHEKTKRMHSFMEGGIILLALSGDMHVQMLDRTTVKARLLYHQEHYGLAFLEIVTDELLPVASFQPEVQYAKDLLALARDPNFCLQVKHQRVHFLNVRTSLCNHHLRLDGVIPTCGIGGPVINHNGEVVGIVSHAMPDSVFVPSSIILNCLHLWKEFQCIPRPLLGLKLWDMELLDPTHIEMIVCKCNIDTGLIVQEVSEGSVAEKIKVRPGDVIDSFNGDPVSSRIEFENKLLQIVLENLSQGKRADSVVNFKIGVYLVRCGIRKDKQLTADISDHAEIFS